MFGAPLRAHRTRPLAVAPSPYGPLWDPPYNTADHLDIPVPGLASTEAMHPDVLDMGAAWHGYRYWMAFTPYNGNQHSEEPCIVATNDITDGGTWVVPAGYTNPIAADPVGDAHMADTDLIYDPVGDRLLVYYIADNGSTVQNIVVRTTDGGGTWTAAVTLVNGSDLGNPSVIPTPSGWRLYYNHSDVSLCFRDSATPDSGYGAETVCIADISLGPFPRGWQNVNVVYDTNGDVIVVLGDSAVGSGGKGGKLRFARSTDGGTTFTVGAPIIEANPVDGWDRSGIYRSSVLVTTDGVVVVDDDLVHVWYSASTEFGAPNDAWGTAYVQLPYEVLG